MTRLLRYGVAAIGPVGSAGAQFALSLLLLRLLDPAQFGSFAFMLVASQLSWGLWSALFCAPMPILLHRSNGEAREALLRCLFSTNLIVAALAFLMFWGMGVALRVPTLATLLFAAYGAIALLRWFARAHAYAIGTPMRTLASDLVYSGTLMAGVGIAAFGHAGSLNIAYAALMLSAALGLLPFGRTYLVRQFGAFSLPAVRDYPAIWKEHSGWSLLGVLTTEATANSHAYIITLLYGPKAFAPIAASALLIRPISVAINALIEFERAQMARLIGQGRIASVNASVRTFRLALALVWLVTAAAAALLFIYAPRLLFPPHYDMGFLITGAALWLVVAAMRMARTPESALLQAAGAFRPLAYASVVSSGFSVVAVLLLLAFGGPLWSILGIFVGEAVFASRTWVQAHRWRVAHIPAPATPAFATTGEGTELR